MRCREGTDDKRNTKKKDTRLSSHPSTQKVSMSFDQEGDKIPPAGEFHGRIMFRNDNPLDRATALRDLEIARQKEPCAHGETAQHLVVGQQYFPNKPNSSAWRFRRRRSGCA